MFEKLGFKNAPESLEKDYHFRPKRKRDQGRAERSWEDQQTFLEGGSGH